MISVASNSNNSLTFILSFFFQLTDNLVTWNQVISAASNSNNNNNSVDIINMEDEDDDFSASNPDMQPQAASVSTAAASEASEATSPFNNLRDLLCHSAHLTVFLNYVLSNSDPASLVSFFF